MESDLKILFIAMPSIHFLRWIENLKDTPHQLHWFDILNRGVFETDIVIRQYTDWKKNKIPFKGKTLFKNKLPLMYEKVQPFLEVTISEILQKLIKEIQPDIVHSFEMQSCSYPIYKVMCKNPSIKWVYSCWGSDLFYYRTIPSHKSHLQKTLKRIDEIQTDSNRDFEIAKQLGFQGRHSGIIPGGGGFNLDEMELLKQPLHLRKIILVKGYQHKFGRGLNIVKALEQILSEIKEYEVIVFGAHEEVITYVNENNLPFQMHTRHGLEHDALLKLLGASLIYIGNSISDGMPNTLLEAICMGVFPIQSNPGGVTEEIITDGKNGRLIQQPQNIEHISHLIKCALQSQELLKKAQLLNFGISKKRLDYRQNGVLIRQIYNVDRENSCE